MEGGKVSEYIAWHVLMMVDSHILGHRWGWFCNFDMDHNNWIHCRCTYCSWAYEHEATRRRRRIREGKAPW
jgi:hypothetical protein